MKARLKVSTDSENCDITFNIYIYIINLKMPVYPSRSECLGVSKNAN